MELQLKHKKSFTDFVSLFFALAVIFGIAIFALILNNTYDDHIKDKLNDALTESTAVDADSNVTKILDQTGSGISKFNPLFPLLIVGVFAFVLVMALMSKSHPAFLFIGLIVLCVALILGAVFSNVYETIGDHSEFSDTNADFSIMALFLGNLPVIILILFVAIAIILYALPGKAAGGQY